MVIIDKGYREPLDRDIVQYFWLFSRFFAIVALYEK